ncbi:MAG TPA: tetratricopeptide repeat protein [Burkholderiaceae bacterium]|nr:tetratricopeptide repeat protein [Burkholderiaceae bacterium]
MATHPYTLRDAEKLLGIPRAALISLIRAGYVPDTRGHRREYRLSFQDIVMLKAARGLMAARISPRRIARSLAALRAASPEVAAASPIRLQPVGRDVTVAGNGSLQSIESGQLLLDFGRPANDTASLFTFRAEAPADEPAADGRGTHAAERWTLRGAAIEATRPQAAIEAYRRAIDADDTYTAAYVNLGIVLSAQNRLREAADVLQLAIARCAPEAVLHFNLGTVLEDLDRPRAAIEQYEHALRLEPDLADAHYNLGRLHERLGHPQLAIRHFNQYRRLEPEGR